MSQKTHTPPVVVRTMVFMPFISSICIKDSRGQRGTPPKKKVCIILSPFPHKSALSLFCFILFEKKIRATSNNSTSKTVLKNKFLNVFSILQYFPLFSSSFFLPAFHSCCLSQIYLAMLQHAGGKLRMSPFIP